MSVKVIHGDCMGSLAELPDQSVHCCVTSPPYFGLRDYGHAGQIGLVAQRHGRNAVLCELNPEYAGMAATRIRGESPLLSEVTCE